MRRKLRMNDKINRVNKVRNILKDWNALGERRKIKGRWTETRKRQEADGQQKEIAKEKWLAETRAIGIPREGILRNMDG